MTITVRDLTDAAGDRDRFVRFYGELYTASFPDADERESLENMLRFLELKREGWYGPNGYHIALMLDGESVVAASVSDYFDDPNCGVIEFILVDAQARGRGLGRRMHEATLALLQADARSSGRAGLDFMFIELNDPFRVPPADDNFDPFERAMLWDRWGYGRLCFPYVQPALSERQRPVDCLLLAAKPLVPQLAAGFPSDLVRRSVEAYLIWAMRIPHPRNDVSFRAMAAYLDGVEQVPMEALAAYVGRDTSLPLAVRPLLSGEDADYAAMADVYRRAFPAGPTAVDPQAFAAGLRRMQARTDTRYHLWALAETDSAPVHGMAAFFSTRRFGFGGYLILEPPLRGRGLARVLVKRMEEQMIRDAPKAREWYVECDIGSTQERVFASLGFEPVPVRYFQPPLVDSPEGRAAKLGPELTLMRKGFGASFTKWQFEPTEFAAVLHILLGDIYRLPEPEKSRCFRVAMGIEAP
jgi:GNAT superfamily N-acetyltransferase